MSLNFSHLGPDNPMTLHMQYLAEHFCLCGILMPEDRFMLEIDGGEVIVIHEKCGKKLHESTINTLELHSVPVILDVSKDRDITTTYVTMRGSNGRAIAG